MPSFALLRMMLAYLWVTMNGARDRFLLWPGDYDPIIEILPCDSHKSLWRRIK